MANQPDPNTASTSFTLPRQLFAALERKAKAGMTNKSDIVRKALMNYLTPAERAQVEYEIAANSAKIDQAADKIEEDARRTIRNRRRGAA